MTGSASPARPRGRWWITLIAAVAAVALVAAGWVALDRAGVPLPGRHRIYLTLGISLVPDATGTVVEVVGETSDESLPTSLDLDLVDTDDAPLVAGGPATGGRLSYSDVRDGLGNTLPADQVRVGRLQGVGTDRHRLRLTYHVAAIDGKRIVYPIPRTRDLDWVAARLYVQNATVICWGNAPLGSSAFGPCAGPQTNEIDGSRHADIRLEVTPQTKP